MPRHALPNPFARLSALLVPSAAVMMLAIVPAGAQDAGAETPAEAPAGASEAPASGDAPAAPAQVDPETVLAVVDGEEITEADLAFAAQDLAQDLQQIPAAEQRAFLLTVLIDMKVMANAAEAEGLADSAQFERQLDYMRDQALRGAFFAEMVQPTVTQEEIEATYNELISGFEAQEEVRARHILVETEEEANEIRAEIEGGMSFEQAAIAYSSDGSAQNGGDLGYFTAGMMVPPFEEAAFALEPGELSAPVESQFGWHLIQLEDRRQSAPPPLEQVSQQVAQQVLYTNFAEMVEELKTETEIEIPDAELASQVEAQSAM